MNAAIPDSILHDGWGANGGYKSLVAGGAENGRGVPGREQTDSFPFRPLPGAGSAGAVAACAWGRACGPEADGFVPASRRGHTFPGREIRQLAIRDPRRGPCLKLEWPGFGAKAP